MGIDNPRSTTHRQRYGICETKTDISVSSIELIPFYAISKLYYKHDAAWSEFRGVAGT